MPEPLLVLADLAFGSKLRIPSVAETATTDPSRRERTTGKYPCDSWSSMCCQLLPPSKEAISPRFWSETTSALLDPAAD